MYTDLFQALLNRRNPREHPILSALLYAFCPTAAHWWFAGADPTPPFDPVWRSLEDLASGGTLLDHLTRYGFDNLVDDIRDYIHEVDEYRKVHPVPAPELLAQIEQTLLSCAADGAYDKRKVYDALNDHSPDVEILIPPRKNAHIWQHGNSKDERLKRDENLRSIRKHGRQQWKQNSGYHIRSLAETIMFRLKTIFGDKLSARLLYTQTTQTLIRCLALNRMTHLGMPKSYLVG